MRIITGTQRGKKLKAPEGDRVRPTADRVKEALFNILQFQLEGRRFLDLFAGSGQIGLEALSRGAARVSFVDSGRDSLKVLEENVKATGFQEQADIYRMDGISFLESCQESFDLAFLDPPYETGLLEQALERVGPLMHEGGKIVCEHPQGRQLPDRAGPFSKEKSYRYGKIMLTCYQMPSSQGPDQA